MAVAFVTGGTRGIGLAVVQALVARGDSVAFTGRSIESAQRTERAVAMAAGDATRVMGLTCDVRERASVRRAVDAAVQRFGGIDLLVNNAGVGGGGPIEDLDEAEWHRLIDTNLTGVFHCSQAAIPHLKVRGGWIINISSLAGKNAFAGGAAYCATKAGLDAFSDALMEELRHDGIRVAQICPGSVATGFNNRPPDAGAEWKLHAEDVASVIAHLLVHPPRSLPSRIEIRPARPPRK
jgi:NAD(P)-dependent dehydrogenase (short-subunit alcohol dehydrogenase family)